MIIFGDSESWRHEVSPVYNIFYDTFHFDALPELFWASKAENGQKREIYRLETLRESFEHSKAVFGEAYHRSLHPTWKC